MDIRESIKSNFIGLNEDDIKDSINESIKTKPNGRKDVITYFKREKEIYRNYDVEENMRHPNGDTDYYPFEEKYPSVHYYDNWGSYYLTIKEMEVQ